MPPVESGLITVAAWINDDGHMIEAFSLGPRAVHTWPASAIRTATGAACKVAWPCGVTIHNYVRWSVQPRGVLVCKVARPGCGKINENGGQCVLHCGRRKVNTYRGWRSPLASS